MPERLKPEPAYDSGWNDPSLGGQDEDPLAELARLVQGVGSPTQPLVRPAPPRGEGGFRTPASRFAPAPSAPAQQAEPDPVLSDFDHSDLASDLEAELMRDLQDSFAAVRAPIEQQPPLPEPDPSHSDELDFDAFADMHLRQSNPMDARSAPRQQPEEQAAIESLASWREVKEARFKPKGAAPIIRPRADDPAAAAVRAPERPAPRALQAAPITDPIAADPDIAAVAAVADSFARSPVREPQRGLDPLEQGLSPEDHAAVPGYGPGGRSGFHDDEDELAAPPRRGSGGRKGLILVASLLGVVLVGTLAVFGFKGLSGDGATGEPPLITADTAPTKVRAADTASTSADSGKLVYDRIGGGDDTADASLAPENTVTTVPRPETHSTEASREISRIILPDPQDPQVPRDQAATAEAPSAEESAVGPKRVRTVVVRPDGTIVSSTAAPATASAATGPTQQPQSTGVATNETTADTRPAAPPPVVDERPPQAAKPKIPPTVDDTATLGDDFDGDAVPPPAETDLSKPAVRGTQTEHAPESGTGPISLLPKSGSSEKPAAKPAERQVAAVEPAAPVAKAEPPTAASGSYYVQISSQRSEDAALASFRAAQKRFPGILGDRAPDIQRADLGDKGIYFRARVAPGLSSSEANKLCAALKSAGGDCIVTAN